MTIVMARNTPKRRGIGGGTATMTGQTDKAFFKEQIGTTMDALYGNN